MINGVLDSIARCCLDHRFAREGLPMGWKYLRDDLPDQAVPKGGDAIA